MSTSPTSAPDNLPTPDDSVLLLIDHQPFPYLHSHDATTVSANAVGLGGAARKHHVPTVLTTVVEECNGAPLQPLQDVLAHQPPIQRHVINPWEDHRVTDAVAATGRTKLVVAGLHTEAAVTLAALRATAEGLGVYVVTDACGGVMAETHDLAVVRMARAGVTPVTRAALARAWHRSRAREATVADPVRATGQGVESTSTTGWNDGGTLTALPWAHRLLAAPAARM